MALIVNFTKEFTKEFIIELSNMNILYMNVEGGYNPGGRPKRDFWSVFNGSSNTEAGPSNTEAGPSNITDLTQISNFRYLAYYLEHRRTDYLSSYSLKTNVTLQYIGWKGKKN